MFKKFRTKLLQLISIIFFIYFFVLVFLYFYQRNLIFFCANKEYFVNLYQNALAHFQINLTDSRNRAIPYTGNQLTTGNRFFTATLRVDIVQDVAYGQQTINNVNNILFLRSPEEDEELI